MARSSTSKPIRRSPLADVHASLGAAWVADDAQWPAGYGDSQREAEAIRSRAGLLDWGPLTKLYLKGPTTEGALKAAGAEPQVGRVAAFPGEDGVEAWWLAPDEALIIGPAGGTRPADLAARLTSFGARVTELSSGLAAFQLLGSQAAAILGELSPLNLRDDVLADGALTRGPVAKVAATVARRDRDGLPGFALLLPRDLARYAWDAMLHSGERRGLRPVGAAAARSLGFA